VKEKQVAKLLADETTLNPKEAEMTLYQHAISRQRGARYQDDVRGVLLTSQHTLS
jgi:hypothetical protein